MKKVLSIILSVLMVVTLFGTAIVANADDTVTYKLNDETVLSKVRPVGRYELVENGLACDWVASGFEFTADCEGDVSVTMTASCSDVGSKGDWNKDGYLTVFIDGVRQNYRVRYMSGTLTVNIAEDLPAGVHTFRVFDQGDLGTKIVFHSVNLSGTLGEKPQEKEVIEFIGDSITVGFGSLDNPSGPAARYSDATRTYAFITAENFGMEARVVARSGGTMNSEYTDYTTNQRAGGSYDYSLKKPKAVVIALGANDGAKTIDYYKTTIKKFVDAIRTGYNDINIPFVFTSYLMSTGEALRYNQTQAIKLLQEQDPVAYGNLHYAFCDTNAGGHPNQAQHLKAGNRLTRELIELGVMSETDLRDDATITLTKNETAQSNINKFDSVVGVGKPLGSSVAYSGITGEVVDALDPADAGSETAKAVKYTVDGTQESTSDYRYLKVTAGTIQNAIMNTKGISFYINYKDTDYTGAEGQTWSTPKIVLSAGDKMKIMSIPGVEDGKTTKVELYWNTMPDSGYVLLSTFSGGAMKVGLDFSGACEYTIDNVKTINTTYRYATNANKAYTYTTGYDSYPLIGVTDNYEAPTTVTTKYDENAAISPDEVTDPDNWVVGWYNSETGIYSPTYNGTLENERAAVKSLVKVDSQYVYGFTILNNDEYGLRVVIREYDSNGKFIRSWGGLGSGEHYTPTDSNVKYASVTIYGNVANTINLVKNNTISVIMQVTGENVKYDWDLTADNFTVNSGSTLKPATDTNSFFSEQYANDGTHLISAGNTVGCTATLKSKATVKPGVYSTRLFARVTGKRALVNLFVNGVKVKSNLNTGNTGANAFAQTSTQGGYDLPIPLDENTIAIASESQVEFTITITKVDGDYSGNLYFNSLELSKIGEYDGSEVPSSSSTSTTTTTTTVATKDYYDIDEVALASSWIVGQWNMSNGTYESGYQTRACTKKLVKIDPSKSYILDAPNTENIQFVVREYTANKSFARSYGTVTPGGKYTPTDSNVSYVGLVLYEGSPLGKITNGTLKPSMVEATGEETSSTTTTTTTQKVEESSSVPAGENGIVKTVLYTMDESGVSANTDVRHPEKAGIIDSGEEDHGNIMRMGAVGDTSAYLYFPAIKASDYDYGIITKITFDYKLKSDGNLWLYQGLKVRAGGSWINAIYDSKTPGYRLSGYASKWSTCTIDLTTSNSYYASLSNAINTGIDGIIFAQTKSTTNFYVDNITVYVEKFSENRQEQAKPDAPVVTEVTGSSVTLQQVSNALYSKDGGLTWQVSNKFTGLTPATEYQFAMKLMQTVDYFESEVSDITKVTTNYEYVFKASDSSPKASGGTAKTDVWQNATDGTGTYNYVRHYDPAVGNKISFTIKGLTPGKYELIVGSRNLASRPTYSAVVTDTLGNSSSFGSLNFADLSTVDPKNPTATYHRLTTGTEIGQIYSNGTLTLTLTITSIPASVSTTHIDSFKFVKVGDLEQDGEITSALSTQSTAAIRLGEVNGMRFYTAVDEAALAELIGDKEYEIGTIIAPKDKVGEYLTMEDSVAKVVYDYAKFGLYKDGDFAGVVGSIVNLRSSNSYNTETGNLARDFVARAYVLVDGVYYYSASTCVRSIAQIADYYIADANSNYSTLDANVKEMVDTWAKAND